MGCRALAVVGGVAAVFGGLGPVRGLIACPGVCGGVLKARGLLVGLGRTPVRLGDVLVGLLGQIVGALRGLLSVFDGLFGRVQHLADDVGPPAELLDSVDDLLIALHQSVDAMLRLVTPVRGSLTVRDSPA